MVSQTTPSSWKPSQHTHRIRRLSVGCYISRSNVGHLSLGPHPSLSILMDHISAPQTREQMPASASPVARDLHTLVGERQHHDLSVLLLYPWRERERAKLLEARAAAGSRGPSCVMCVLCCLYVVVCCCVFCCVDCRVDDLKLGKLPPLDICGERTPQGC